MSQGLFVTGTDTGVGKTVVSAGLLHWLTQRGQRVVGYKPVAAGCERTSDGWRNEDALALLAASSTNPGYEQVNPLALPDAVAPHLAAENQGVPIDLNHLVRGFRNLQTTADWVIAEGAGGWLVPLDGEQGIDTLARMLGQPVVLVVGLRLGCINHARLTAQAIATTGLSLCGWVGSVIDPDMPELAGNVATLKRLLPAPCLGVVPWLDSPSAESAAAALDDSALLSVFHV